MSRSYDEIAARAWSLAAESNTCFLEAFLRKFSAELHGELNANVDRVDLAFTDWMGRQHIQGAGVFFPNTSSFVTSLVIESERSMQRVRIYDQANRGIGIGHSGIYQSVVLVFKVPDTLAPSKRAYLVCSVAQGKVISPALVELLKKGMEQLGTWFASYGAILRRWAEQEQKRDEHVKREQALVHLAHDAKAPLSSLSYRLSLVQQGQPFDTAELAAFEADLKYLEGVISGFRGDEAGDSALHSDLSAVGRRIERRFSPVARRRGIAFSVTGAEDETIVRCSSLAVERILTNLVSNALHYSEEGAVVVSLARDNERGLLKVQDTGPGIDPEIVHKINRDTDSALDSVHRDGTNTNAGHGWGIGLIATKRQVQALCGGFQIVSYPGRGTTIEISLPRVPRGSLDRNKSVPPASTLPHTSAACKGHVILVDDDREQSDALARILRKMEYSVESVTSIGAALEYMQQVSGHSTSQAILCDINMPDGGAEKLLQALKGYPQRIRVAVLSGERGEDTMYRCAALGAEAYFPKPSDPRDLCTWLDSVIAED